MARWSASKPGSIRCACCRLRRKRPAPTSAMSDSATCDATSRLRRPKRRFDPLGALVRSFSSTTRSGFDAWTAGARPKRTPVASATSEGEEQHAPVRVQVERIGRQERRPERPEQPLRPVREQHPGRAADEREQRALGQQLAHQPAASGAERQPHRDLLLPRRRAGEQQVRDVRARDQEHEADDRHQQTAGRHEPGAEAGIEDRRLRQRQRGHVAPMVVVRILLRELLADRPEVGFRLLDRHARLDRPVMLKTSARRDRTASSMNPLVVTG